MSPEDRDGTRILVTSDEEILALVLEAVREAPDGTVNERLRWAMQKTKGACNPATVRAALEVWPCLREPNCPSPTGWWYLHCFARGR